MPISSPIGGIAKNWTPSKQDLRPDGTRKGNGWLGALKRPDGGVSSEITVGVHLGGKPVDIPLVVPGLNKAQLDYLLNNDVTAPEFKNNDMYRSIESKAAKHAMQRLKSGLSPFKD